MSANKSRRKRPATAAEREHGDQERRERLVSYPAQPSSFKAQPAFQILVI